jgi:hypothetical protein
VKIVVNQELKTVVLHLWELKIQKIKMIMPGGTTVNVEVKRLSLRVMRKKREQMMKVQREVRYQISMKRRSLIKLDHYSK